MVSLSKALVSSPVKLHVHFWSPVTLEAAAKACFLWCSQKNKKCWKQACWFVLVFQRTYKEPAALVNRLGRAV